MTSLEESNFWTVQTIQPAMNLLDVILEYWNFHLRCEKNLQKQYIRLKVTFKFPHNKSEDPVRISYTSIILFHEWKANFANLF